MNLWGIIKGLLIQDETDRSKELSLEVDPASTTDTRMTVKSAQTADRTLTLPDATDTLVGRATTDTLTNKSINADQNTITNIEDADIKAGAAINANKIGSGNISNAEYEALDNVSGNIQSQIDATNSALAAHIADPTDAHDASAISNIPAGTVSSTDVQSAVNELDGDIQAHINDATDAHDASAISNIPSGNLVATDVQGALNELQTDVDTRATSAALTAHINDTSDAHDASAISVVPTGNLSSTEVQAALVELQTDIDGIAAGTSTASNIGTGEGVFAQKVVNDLEFKSLVAGTNVTLTPSADEILIDVSVPASGANTTLSNLTSPTDINQDLTFDNASNRNISIETMGVGADTAGRTLTISGGGSEGTNRSGGDVQIKSGSSTGSTGSRINFFIVPTGQASGTSVRNSGQAAVLFSSTSEAQLAILSPVNASSNCNLEFATRLSENTIRNGVDNTAGASRTLNIEGATNNSTGNSGAIQIFTQSKPSGTGNSGQISISTGSADSGNSGSIALSTGSSVSGSRGQIAVQARNFYLQQTPLVYDVSILSSYGVTPTNQLPVGGFGIVRIQSTTAITINGIEAGVEGQHLIIYNQNANNMTFNNLNGSAVAADQIITCTGGAVTSTTTSMHQFVYLGGKWVMLGNQL